jgi:MFS family permease
MSAVGRQAGKTFESLTRSRSFRLFFFGQLVSVTGTWFNATATSVLVLQLSNSGVALGLNTGALFLPVLLFGAFGGILADRYDRRRILVVTQVLFMAIAIVLWWLVRTDSIQLWMVFTLSLVNGIVTAADNPTRQSFYMEMVGKEHLTNAVSLNSAVFTGTRILGAALAGELIHGFGLSSAFLIDGVSYLAVIASLTAMRPEDLDRRDPVAREPGQLRAALRYVWNDRTLRRPLLVMAVVFTFSFNFMILLPLAAYRTFHGDARTLGLMSAFAGVGMLSGALLMANRAPHPTWRRLTLFATLFGVLMVVEGFMPTLALGYAVIVPMGFFGMSFAITANATLQLGARPDMRGRVMALYGVLFLGSTPVGAPIVGWAGQQFGPRAGFALGGIAAMSAGIVGLLLWRRDHTDMEDDYEAESLEPEAPSLEVITDVASSGMRKAVAPLSTSISNIVAYQPGS